MSVSWTQIILPKKWNHTIPQNRLYKRPLNTPMIYMMDCAYRSQWIMAEILSQHEGELDLFRGRGGLPLPLVTNHYSPFPLFHSPHYDWGMSPSGGRSSNSSRRRSSNCSCSSPHYSTTIGRCLLKSISDATGAAAAANWANFLTAWTNGVGFLCEHVIIWSLFCFEAPNENGFNVWNFRALLSTFR